LNYRRYSSNLLVILFATLLVAQTDGSRQTSTAHFSDDVAGLYRRVSQVLPPNGSADVLFLENEEALTFDAQGKVTRSRYVLYKILTRKGAEGWADLSVYWDPWREDRPSIRARVITADSTVHTLDEKTITDSPAKESQDSVFSDRRVIRAPLPAISPGSLVEEEQIDSESSPFFAGTVERFYFGGSVPVEHTRLILDLPSSFPVRYVAQLLPDLKVQRMESDGRVHMLFENGHIDAIDEAEPGLPSDVPAYPSVTFSTGNSWQRVAEEYAKLVDQKIERVDLKSTVAGLLSGKKSRDQKISAILQHIDREVRYTGVEFGEATIIPHPPSETLTRKYGDCKDKATLLVAMLRTADIPAYIALLNIGANEDVPSDLPGMGLFDHAIVYIPGNPALWIDATDEYARPGELPNADQNRLALIAGGGSNVLTRTPWSPSIVIKKREILLADNGPARIVETIEPRGSDQSFYRRSYVDKESKRVKDSLFDYVKREYLAEKLDRIDRSDPGDLTTPFQVVLESKHARRGMTDLNTAVAVIRFENLFNRLPSDLCQREKDGEEKKLKDSDEKPKKKRTADYQLPEAFMNEWQYTIVPPAGFQPKPLPKDADLPFGPAKFHEEFAADRDGRVHATVRFDTVKRRLSASEATDLRNNVAQLLEREPIIIYFEPIGDSLLNDGKAREALKAYRDVISAHPKDAVHHLRLAKAFLVAGLGEAARSEGQTAVKLDPNSALAQETLAEILEYDLVGRKFRPGTDYAGAEAAFHAAEKLDPEDRAIVANLAILHEYNRWGLRYGPGAKLKDAVAEYRSLTTDKMHEFGMQNNLAFALFYAGEFSEAQQYAETLNPQPTALIVACEAATNGIQAALIEAKKRTESTEKLKEVASTAGQMLINLRRYSVGADLEEAGASGDSASETAAYAALYRKTVPHEELQLKDDPVGVALRLEILTSDPNLTLSQLGAIASRNGTKAFVIPPVLSNLVKDAKTTISKKARRGEFADVGLDLSITRAQAKVEGNDAIGYKVTLWPSTSYKSVRYIVKEDGQYKVLGFYRFEGVGLEVLDRIAANDLTGARSLLDWRREDLNLPSADDPLAGSPFARMWTKGKGGDVAPMKAAAAAMAAYHYQTAPTAVPILEAALKSAASDADKVNIMIALTEGYEIIESYEKAGSVGVQLAKQYPESKSLFLDQEYNLRTLGRFDEADKLAEERLRRTPGDSEAMHALARNATSRENYAQAHSLSKKIVEDGKADASDFNNIAWYSLFVGKVDATDIENALKATQLSDKETYSLHTLGCVYAVSGKTKEAHDVLLEAMDASDLDEPDSSYSLAFGLIAEQYGERDIALADYARVEKPEKAYQIPSSSYRLAQIRIQALHSDKEARRSF
jgi:transglutaminase-like putative cysteine protease/Flp pilus assembly protein TadD